MFMTEHVDLHGRLFSVKDVEPVSIIHEKYAYRIKMTEDNNTLL